MEGADSIIEELSVHSFALECNLPLPLDQYIVPSAHSAVFVS